MKTLKEQKKQKKKCRQKGKKIMTEGLGRIIGNLTSDAVYDERNAYLSLPQLRIQSSMLDYAL